MKAHDRLLTPSQAAMILHVTPDYVSRLAAAGQIHAEMTPGGHRRFRESEVIKYQIRTDLENGYEPGDAE